MYYTQTSRELRRLLGLARSPVSSQCAEVAAGASTIRAFDAQPRYSAINEHLVACTQRAAIAGTAGALCRPLSCDATASHVARPPDQCCIMSCQLSF